MIYYYYHGESDSLWSSNDPNEYLHGDGLVESIDEHQAIRLQQELGLKTIPYYKTNNNKKMEINKTQLQQALGIVKPGLANKEVIEQSTSFAFVNGRVVTYNDEISLSHPVEGLALEGAIESDKLYQFLTKIKQETIDLEINENEIVITAGKAKAGMTLQSEIKLPIDDVLEGKGKWYDLPDTFLKFVHFCIPSCATVLSKPLLGAVHVNQNGTIEASDGYRITQCHLPEEETMPVNTFLLPHKSAALMVKLMPIKIAEGKGWIHFKTAEETILSCRILSEDVFPDTSKYLQIQGSEVTFPVTIREVLERAAVFSKSGEVDLITVSMAEKKVNVSAKTDLGWFKETINARYSGEPIEFQVNPNLLNDIVAETQVGEIAENKLVFYGDGWTYMTLLHVKK